MIIRFQNLSYSQFLPPPPLLFFSLLSNLPFYLSLSLSFWLIFFYSEFRTENFSLYVEHNSKISNLVIVISIYNESQLINQKQNRKILTRLKISSNTNWNYYIYIQWSNTLKGKNDVSIFDFTHLYRSENASRILRTEGATLLTGNYVVATLCSLVETFV